MAIEEKEAQETLLKELIEKVEKDPLPTHIFTTEDTDPLVLLGKLNEIIAKLKDLKALYVSSDTKATQALDNAINALTNATQALQSANTALSTANTAIDTANTALDTANTAIDISNDAVDTATTLGNQANNKADNAVNQANEALRVAQEALNQIVEGLGSKVYDIAGNLLTSVKFKGDNSINVDMSEDDPETFDIRLDETITQAIEYNNTLAQNNKSSIDSINEDITGIKQAQASDSLAIVELQSKNLTQDEEISNLQGNVTANSQKLQRALLLPVATPSEKKLVGIDNDNTQILLNIVGGLEIVNGAIQLKDVIDKLIQFTQGVEVGDNGSGVGAKLDTLSDGRLRIRTAGSSTEGAIEINGTGMVGWVKSYSRNHIEFSTGYKIVFGTASLSGSNSNTNQASNRVTFSSPFNTECIMCLANTIGQNLGSGYNNTIMVQTPDTTGVYIRKNFSEARDIFYLAVGH